MKPVIFRIDNGYKRLRGRFRVAERVLYRVFCGTNTRFVGIVPITEQPIPSLVTEKARDLAKFY